jgi:Domain of unknown function (DUF4148)
MNTKHMTVSSLLVVLLAASAGVRAEQPSTDVLDFVSSRTRAEVRTELFAYKKAGVNPWATYYDQLKSFRSVTTRREVRDAFFSSREEDCALYGEDSGSMYLSWLGTPGGAVAFTRSLPRHG